MEITKEGAQSLRMKMPTAELYLKEATVIYSFYLLMHQSIPAVPIPAPPGNRGAFAHVVSPGGGAFAVLSRHGDWALAYPGATPGHLKHVFSKDR